MNPSCPNDIEYDENCDPNNPRRIKYDDIQSAAQRIAQCVPPTICAKSSLSEKLGMDLYLKQEFLNYTGSFKERGICNALLLLDDEAKKNGVVVAGSANHGLAISYHAKLLGIPSIVVMPINAATTKVARCQKYGTKLLLHGTNLRESKLYAMALAKEKKMYFINSYDHPHVIEGQGTVGMEIIEQVPNVDAIIVPCGGGSLLSGIAVAVKHLKPDTEIYGVETNKNCSMNEALKRNSRFFMEMGTSLADSLNINIVGVNTFHTLKGLVDKMVVVAEQWVARAILDIIEQDKFIVEGAGAVTVGAILANQLPNLKGKTVVCVCSGGNIDTATLARAMERGLAAEGRLVKCGVTISDRPCAMSELCHQIASVGATVREFVPDKCWLKGSVCSLDLKLTIETKGWDHTKEVVELIKKNYKEHSFQDMAQKPDSVLRRGPCLAPQAACMSK